MKRGAPLASTGFQLSPLIDIIGGAGHQEKASNVKPAASFCSCTCNRYDHSMCEQMTNEIFKLFRNFPLYTAVKKTLVSVVDFSEYLISTIVDICIFYTSCKTFSSLVEDQPSLFVDFCKC